MSINIDVLAETALDQALAAAKGHAGDLKAYVKKRSKIIANGIAALAKDYEAGLITDSDVSFAWGEILASERTARLATGVTARAALQDAVNAALAVAAGAFNQLVGIKLL